MLQKSLNEQKQPSGLLVWILITATLYAGYTLITRNIIPPDNSLNNQIQQSNLRETALDVERQLARLISGNPGNLEGFKNPDFTDYKQQRYALINNVSQQANISNYREMANRLLELGELSIESLELIDAELYLEEALEIAWMIDSPQLKAQSYQQLGHLNIKKRNLARRSAFAYDSLLVVRNQIALNQFENTESILQTIVNDNLAIRRFGAAASALETRAAYHEKLFEFYQANLAYIEAAQLWAITGASQRARQLINKLHKNEIDEFELSRVNEQIEASVLRYESDRYNNATAQDLKRLYFLYKERGEEQKAWEFRLQANEIMLKTSDQAMYQRQPDVLAVLYKSNTAMDKAEFYLDKAAQLFKQQGMSEQLEKTEGMKALVF